MLKNIIRKLTDLIYKYKGFVGSICCGINTKNCNFLHLNKLTATILLCNFIGIILTLIYNDTIIVDMWEHLRATYLINLGNLPYRDFFEHHHPLLWYVFLPIMGIFPRDAIIIYYTARIIALLCSLGTMWLIYLTIKRFFKGKNFFIPFLVILFTFFPVWYMFSAFKPEAFAHLFYFAGLYFCFAYIQNCRCAQLVWGGICFVIAFLFIQTMIFNISFIGIALIAICYKRKDFGKHIFAATIVPALILIILCYMLYKLDVLNTYFQLNWLYNTKINLTIPLSIWNWLLQLLTAVCAFCCLKKTQPSPYFNIIFVLLMGEVLLVFCFHKSFPHYLYLMFIYTSILLGAYIQNINNKTTQRYILAFIISCLLLNYITLIFKNNLEKMTDFRIVNQSQQSSVLNINSGFINIYGEDFSYYEMFAMRLVSIDICYFNRFPNYNLEQHITDNQYTYLAYDSDKPSSVVCSEDRFVVNDDILKNYNRISTNIYKRK